MATERNISDALNPQCYRQPGIQELARKSGKFENWEERTPENELDEHAQYVGELQEDAWQIGKQTLNQQS